ncbi:hypothetical protein [Fodinicola feengrottensis]|uniref:hypothetical protein n=1 Tax=Fodinicola feengrottensis TaxID=435914 RepID=UPI0013D76418|nr:hypothetical protein [Fodinicola feengrottensis]
MAPVDRPCPAAHLLIRTPAPAVLPVRAVLAGTARRPDRAAIPILVATGRRPATVVRRRCRPALVVHRRC